MGKTILIVEDNALNMRLFNDLLQASGFMTVQTMDGRDALALAHEHGPDLVLMDIRLPGVSGLEIVRMMKADRVLRTIPVVAVTVLAMRGDEERIRAGGFDGYVAKPISVSVLLETVNGFLG